MFQVFPKRWWSHDCDHNAKELMTNLCLRVAIPERFRVNASLYLSYIVADGETPSDIAEKLYDDPSLYWTIYYANSMLNPTTHWPKSTHDLHRWMVDKFGYEKMGDVHHYEDMNGNIVDPEAMMYSLGYVGATIAQAVERYSLRAVSNEQYYTTINEKRRSIRLIAPEYISSFTSEMEKLINE